MKTSSVDTTKTEEFSCGSKSDARISVIVGEYFYYLLASEVEFQEMGVLVINIFHCEKKQHQQLEIFNFTAPSFPTIFHPTLEFVEPDNGDIRQTVWRYTRTKTLVFKKPFKM